MWYHWRTCTDASVCSVYSPTLPMAITWWRHQMETFSELLAICAGNSPVTGEFPAQRPVTRSFDVFFDLRLNKRLSKQSWGWWFEKLSCPLWRHRNDLIPPTWQIAFYTQGASWMLSVDGPCWVDLLGFPIKQHLLAAIVGRDVDTDTLFDVPIRGVFLYCKIKYGRNRVEFCYISPLANRLYNILLYIWWCNKATNVRYHIIFLNPWLVPYASLVIQLNRNERYSIPGYQIHTLFNILKCTSLVSCVEMHNDRFIMN